MEVTIRPKNFKLPDHVESQIRKRVARLPRHLENLQLAEIILTQEPTRSNPQRMQYIAQLTLHARNNLIRCEVANAELLTAIDEAMDRLSRQIERYKARYYRSRKGLPGLGKSSADVVSALPVGEAAGDVETANRKAAPPASPQGEQFTEDEGEYKAGNIVRVKTFDVKPTFPDEAVEQMELLGHNFYVFLNANDQKINVLYRRRDGDYGLLQPELS